MDPYHKNDHGDTALIAATVNGHAEIVRLFLELGADPNSVNHYGRAALMMGVSGNYLEITKDLLAWRGDPNSVDINNIDNSETAVFLSAAHNCNIENDAAIVRIWSQSLCC